jgi:hypothetical protein
MRVVAAGHAVVCKDTRAIMFVDFVFEHWRGSRRQCYLASVYQARCRGGPALHYARSYMRAVQRICNRDMNFFPKVLAMCVYGGGAARVYARDVGL